MIHTLFGMVEVLIAMVDLSKLTLNLAQGTGRMLIH